MPEPITQGERGSDRVVGKDKNIIQSLATILDATYQQQFELG